MLSFHHFALSVAVISVRRCYIGTGNDLDPMTSIKLSQILILLCIKEKRSRCFLVTYVSDATVCYRCFSVGALTPHFQFCLDSHFAGLSLQRECATRMSPVTFLQHVCGNTVCGWNWDASEVFPRRRSCSINLP